MIQLFAIYVTAMMIHPHSCVTYVSQWVKYLEQLNYKIQLQFTRIKKCTELHKMTNL